jgi:hypothetical protein
MGALGGAAAIALVKEGSAGAIALVEEGRARVREWPRV